MAYVDGFFEVICAGLTKVSAIKFPYLALFGFSTKLMKLIFARYHICWSSKYKMISFCNHESVAAMKQIEENFFSVDVYLKYVFVIHGSILYFLHIITFCLGF